MENHKDAEYVESRFKNAGFDTSYTNPLSLNSGHTHGGELLAIRSGFSSRNVPKHILEHIIKEYGELRFATRIIEFHNVDILVVTLYLWVTEGLSVRNNMILYQTRMLKHLLSLPFFTIGDFNITFEQFVESGWAERFKAKMLHPGTPTTTTASTNRVIDFGF